jgi:hypothetical protein
MAIFLLSRPTLPPPIPQALVAWGLGTEVSPFPPAGRMGASTSLFEVFGTITRVRVNHRLNLTLTTITDGTHVLSHAKLLTFYRHHLCTYPPPVCYYTQDELL